MKKIILFINIFAALIFLGSCYENFHGVHRYSFKHDGYKRFFNVYIPKSYDGSKAVPLVLDLHGIYQNATDHQRYTGFDKVAESENGGFIVIYPEGITTLGNPNVRSWSATLDEASWRYHQFISWGYIADHFLNDTDDVGFIVKIVEEATKYLNINKDRVYLAGLSQGGALALRCAYERSDLFAAVFASSSGMLLDLELFKPLDPPIPVMKINAYEDELVKYDGIKYLGARLQSVNEAFEKWGEINGCSENDIIVEPLYEYKTEELNGLNGFDESYGTNDICKSYINCNSGVQVKQCSIHGKHDLYNYPSKEGKDVINHWGKFSISELAWSFFNQFK